MAGFDSSNFDPQTFRGLLGWLQQNMQQGLLPTGDMPGQGFPPAQAQPMQPQIGPTYAAGDHGMMGGVPFPIAPGPEPSALPPNAQPAGPAQPGVPDGGILSALLSGITSIPQNLGLTGGPTPPPQPQPNGNPYRQPDQSQVRGADPSLPGVPAASIPGMPTQSNPDLITRLSAAAHNIGGKGIIPGLDGCRARSNNRATSRPAGNAAAANVGDLSGASAIGRSEKRRGGSGA